MNRTIKFRGKRIDNGEWVHGSLDLTDNSAAISWDRIDNDGDIVPWFANVDPDTVGQFTGLHDKNGKEIYEGDILDFPEDKDFLPETVIFNEGCFMVEGDYSTIAMNTIDTEYRTIISNIHDNPELLNEK